MMQKDIIEGGWVASTNAYNGIGFRPRIARVKHVYDDGSLDLVLYQYDGIRIGRESPAMDGPTSFEPYCAAENWEPIGEPNFNALSDYRNGYGFHLNWKRPQAWEQEQPV